MKNRMSEGFNPHIDVLRDLMTGREIGQSKKEGWIPKIVDMALRIDADGNVLPQKEIKKARGE